MFFVFSFAKNNNKSYECEEIFIEKLTSQLFWSSNHKKCDCAVVNFNFKFQFLETVDSISRKKPSGKTFENFWKCNFFSKTLKTVDWPLCLQNALEYPRKYKQSYIKNSKSEGPSNRPYAHVWKQFIVSAHYRLHHRSPQCLLATSWRIRHCSPCPTRVSCQCYPLPVVLSGNLDPRQSDLLKESGRRIGTFAVVFH